MVNGALQNRLDGILLLLVMAVSLLSGLVFGRGYDDRVGVAVLSFITLGLGLVALNQMQSSSSE